MVTYPRCKGVVRIVTSKNPGMKFDGRRAVFEGGGAACSATLIQPWQRCCERTSRRTQHHNASQTRDGPCRGALPRSFSACGRGRPARSK
ncbi:hypothetical protein [Burkholderia ubonensis]|uniref:hypothetical protein n=1 Tax=Burkholderia ubonensis TaxID=101571 RepID=UPI002FCB5955